jgi:hypothetical protein
MGARNAEDGAAAGHGDRLSEAARAILVNRRSRLDLLPAELFGEWPWEVLLTLFVADAEGRRLTGRTIIAEIACTPLTMTRWLEHLARTGLIVGDTSDDLDAPLTLSPAGISALESYLAATVQTAHLLGV